MTIIIHPALAANLKAAQLVADRHGLEIVLQGQKAYLEAPSATVAIPARIPAPSRARLPRHIYPTGGDAA